MPLLMEEDSFDTGTVKLNFAQGPPNGPPILLLPSMGRSWKSFTPVIPVLARDWQVYALDYRGHGKSGRVPGHYLAREHYEDLAAFCNHTFSEPLVLLGHSMGGAMAFGYAQEYPQRLRALIVGDASLDQAAHIEKMTTPVMKRFYASTQKLAKKPLDELKTLFSERGTPLEEAEDLSQLDPGILDYHAQGRLVEYFEGIHDPNLDRIPCPILFIQGNPDKGALLSDGEVSKALAEYPHVSHVRIDHAGHDLGFWRGELEPFIQAVIGFLKEIKDA